MEPEDFFAGHPASSEAFQRVRGLIEEIGPVEIRTSRSQVAFRRRRGFAYVWMPGRWLAHPAAETVLSIALPAPQPSPRFKEVIHPSPLIWMHHLEIHHLDDVDREVAGWLADAYAAAG